MFEFLKAGIRNARSKENKDRIARMLKVSPALLERFEEEYAKRALSDDALPENFFDLNAKTASAEAKRRGEEKHDDGRLSDLIGRISDELVLASENGGWVLSESLLPEKSSVSSEEIDSFPEEVRPQLSGRLMKTDLGGVPSYTTLLDQYGRFLTEKDERKRMGWYHLFRQGLDILDLDPITYEMLGMNPNSIGNWFPALKEAADGQDFFRVPKTKIVKVPLPLLQMTRLDWFSLTPSTLRIADEFCMKAFDLDVNGTYFVKTGTYSSKFDFRNAKVAGEKEVRELGEYLLFIHSQANAMAHPTNSPCVYGVSTTNEWCVREYVEDKEGNPCIYKGMPLHTEYRVFVDFDSDEILGISPYWRPDVMKKRFGDGADKDGPHQVHDYVIYRMHEETLMRRYEENKEKVLEGIRKMIPDVNLPGQWSVDVMQNGDDFWLIDMALEENSALANCIPPEKRRKSPENWIPNAGLLLPEK